ncbi:MAG: hypothetical protein Q8N85_06275, partial [Candidatus Omnitrophota bacterium]|nr:hypothetical protein [Candidatus Omnitrophota bacterium]
PLIVGAFPGNAYFLEGRINVFRHALRLCCGLCSQLKGELEIMQQIDGWRRGLPLGLRGIWQAAYLKALSIRKASGLDGPAVNIANVVYEEMKRISGENEAQAIIIGTGRIAELFSLQKPRFLRLSFASHKNKKRGRELAEQSGGALFSFQELKGLLPEADFLISATKGPHFLLRKQDVKAAAVGRSKPLYIYDLALPRDIEPSVKNLEGVILKDLDDLTLNYEEFNLKIKNKLDLADYLIEEAVSDYTHRVPAEQAGVGAGARD